MAVDADPDRVAGLIESGRADEAAVGIDSRLGLQERVSSALSIGTPTRPVEDGFLLVFDEDDPNSLKVVLPRPEDPRDD